MERATDDENPFYLPRQHLPQSDGRVRNEGPGEKGGPGEPVFH